MIRRMESRDLAAVAALARSCFPDPWSEGLFRESLKRPEYLFLICEKDGRILGYAGLLCVMEEGDVMNIAVDERSRRQGAGQALLEALLAEGAAQGVREFTLEVRSGNTAALRLYEKLGFVCEGVRKHYYEHPPEDAQIMWKRR